MKKTYLLLVLFFCCFSMMSIPMNNKSNNVEEIRLEGNFPKHKQRSLVKPIRAFYDGRAIGVDFNAPVGTVVVSVYDETGSAVYRQSVTTSGGQQLFIDISSFEEGEYTIEFVNAQGQYLSGDFEV